MIMLGGNRVNKFADAIIEMRVRTGYYKNNSYQKYKEIEWLINCVNKDQLLHVRASEDNLIENKYK